MSGARPSPGALKLLVWTSRPSSLKKPFSWATKKAIDPIQALNPTRYGLSPPAATLPLDAATMATSAAAEIALLNMVPLLIGANEIQDFRTSGSRLNEAIEQRAAGAAGGAARMEQL